jgi:hypothetical protein
MAMQTSFFEEMKRLVVRASTSIASLDTGVLAPLMVTHVSVSSYVQQRYLAARVEWVPRDLRNADGSPWVEQRSVRGPRVMGVPHLHSPHAHALTGVASCVRSGCFPLPRAALALHLGQGPRTWRMLGESR